MADWNKPTLLSLYATEFLPQILGIITDAARMEAAPTNPPDRYIRYNPATGAFERYTKADGSWLALDLNADWHSQTGVPGFVDGSHYRMNGNVTAAHSVGRRVRFFTNAGTRQAVGTITASTYNSSQAWTEVTVAVNEGSLTADAVRLDLGPDPSTISHLLDKRAGGTIQGPVTFAAGISVTGAASFGSLGSSLLYGPAGGAGLTMIGGGTDYTQSGHVVARGPGSSTPNQIELVAGAGAAQKRAVFSTAGDFTVPGTFWGANVSLTANATVAGALTVSGIAEFRRPGGAAIDMSSGTEDYSIRLFQDGSNLSINHSGGRSVLFQPDRNVFFDFTGNWISTINTNANSALSTATTARTELRNRATGRANGTQTGPIGEGNWANAPGSQAVYGIWISTANDRSEYYIVSADYVTAG